MATLQHYIGYDNVVKFNVVTATSEAAGFPVTNIANQATYPPWRSDSTAAQYVVAVTNGASVDYVGIAEHNLGSIAAYVEVQAQNNFLGEWSVVYSKTLYDESLCDAEVLGSYDAEVSGSYDAEVLVGYDDAAYVSSNRPIILRFETITPFAIRLKIYSSRLFQEPPRIAVLYAGAITQMPHNVYGGVSPVSLSRNVETVEGRSQNGQYLGSVTTRTTYSGSVSLQNLSPSWYRSVFDPFVVAASGHSGAKQPFFYAWRFDDYPEEVAYCWLTDTPTPKNSGTREYMEVALKFDAIA